MKMRYFRFMYWVAETCMIHFGEVKDTKLNETITFLYLSSTKERETTIGSGHSVFVCPEQVDLAVLGTVDEGVLRGLSVILEHTKIETLAVPARSYEKIPAQIKGVGQIVWLGSAEEIQEQRKENPDGREETIENHLERTAAGWKISVKSWNDGTLSMLHMHEENDSEEGQIRYEDCVMNVKELSGEKRCSQNAHPDEYGCALGCVLHQDYDLCKYRKTGDKSGYLTGTLLLAGTGNDKERGMVIEESKQKGVRFFVTDFSEAEEWDALLPDEETEKPEPKRYYIGTRLSDSAIAEICRSGWNRIPTVLQNGKGICCSGLMKYADDLQL